MGCSDMIGYKSRKILGKCVQCGKSLGDSSRIYCPECTHNMAETNRRRGLYREASGMCKTCGEWLSERDRLDNGKMAKHCKECRAKKAEYARNKRRIIACID